MAAWIGTGCQTPAEPEPPVTKAGHVPFRPATFVSMLHAGGGAYADAYSADSYAIWVAPEVTAAKAQAVADAGNPVDPALQRDVEALNAHFLIVELHLNTVFADQAMAYDLVRLRHVDVYLETANGDRVAPVQTLPMGSANEEQANALTRFTQTHTLIFPMEDVWTGVPTVSRETPSVRLTLEAVNSTYYFEWPTATDLEPIPFGIRKEDAVYATKLGYYELYTGLRRIAHTFD